MWSRRRIFSRASPKQFEDLEKRKLHLIERRYISLSLTQVELKSNSWHFFATFFRFSALGNIFWIIEASRLPELCVYFCGWISCHLGVDVDKLAEAKLMRYEFSRNEGESESSDRNSSIRFWESLDRQFFRHRYVCRPWRLRQSWVSGSK